MPLDMAAETTRPSDVAEKVGVVSTLSFELTTRACVRSMSLLNSSSKDVPYAFSGVRDLHGVVGLRHHAAVHVGIPTLEEASTEV
jgi:hypothetical protein